MKKKWTSSAFWLSVTAAVIVVINTVAKVFGFNVDEVAITSIASSVIGLLVVVGVLTKTDNKSAEIEQQTKESNEQNSQETNLTNKANVNNEEQNVEKNN